MKALAIIPAYNEEKMIYEVVKRVQNCGTPIDVVVVNDGSWDHTAQEAKEAGAVLLNLPLNGGIGSAVQTGFLYALRNGYDAAIQVDGDGQHDPADIPRLLEVLDRGEADMVIGSRFLDDTHYQPSVFRNMGIYFFAKLISLLTGNRYTDTTSGYRAVNRKVIKLFALDYPDDYPEPETIFYLHRRGFRIKELSSVMHQRKEGKSSITPLKSVYYMLKVTASLLLPKGKGKRA